jgi:predicted branched-subunit amino acid permease
MSEQQSPTSPTDTSEKVEFGGINLLIGLVIGFVLQFGWWALLDQLPLLAVDLGNDGFLAQLLAVLRQSHTAGFIVGAMLGATNTSASLPIRSVIWESIRWAIGFTLAFYCMDVMRFVLQAALGELLGDIVTSAIWLGLAGAFVGLVLELQRTGSPNIGSAPLSLRQIMRSALKLDRAAVPRILIATLLGTLLGITIEMLFEGLSVWPLMLVLDAVVAVIAVRMWRPSRQTLRKWASGALMLVIIIGLLLLLDVSAQLGVLAGIVVLVGYAILQSRK